MPLQFDDYPVAYYKFEPTPEPWDLHRNPSPTPTICSGFTAPFPEMRRRPDPCVAEQPPARRTRRPRQYRPYDDVGYAYWARAQEAAGDRVRDEHNKHNGGPSVYQYGLEEYKYGEFDCDIGEWEANQRGQNEDWDEHGEHLPRAAPPARDGTMGRAGTPNPGSRWSTDDDERRASAGTADTKASVRSRLSDSWAKWTRALVTALTRKASGRE